MVVMCFRRPCQLPYLVCSGFEDLQLLYTKVLGSCMFDLGFETAMDVKGKQRGC